MDNRPHEQWGTWVMGHMGTRGRVIGQMGDGKHGVMGYMGNVACSFLGLHGSRVMGHMGNRPHEQWDTWPMGHMGDGAHCHNNVLI